MKKEYLIALLFFLSFIGFSWGQTSTVATYSAGHISSDFANTTVITMNSGCPGTLTVPVPAGRYVTSVDVEYDFEALGINFLSEQSSYLECVTTSTKESSVSFGPNINNSGTHSYNRTGLNIANGVVPAGGLQFRLHAWRSFASGGCNNTNQRILNNTFKITVTHIAAPSCLPPTNVAVNSVTANSATIGWTTGGATNWQVEYGPAGFTPGTGTLLQVSTNPYTITGLNASTRYDFVVRDSCGVGNVSFWSNVQTFRTNCSVIAAPWNEDFESTDWQTGTGFNSLGTIDTCFTRNHQNHFTMKAGPPTFVSTFSGPSGDHTTGSGKYLFSERLTFGTFPSTASIVTPPINLSPLSVPELSFWYHMFGTDIHKLEVFISTNGGTTYTSIFSKTGQQQTAATDPWKEATLSLSAYANDTVVLKFEVVQNTAGVLGDLAIDDIDIHEAPSCPKPSNLRFIASSAASITLGWTSGGASNWQIEYGPPGFTIGSGTLINTSTNPTTITGLSANTTYQFYARDSCSATDLSAWSSSVSGKTTCNPVSAPFTENFDGTVWNRGVATNSLGTINTCWNREENLYIFKSGPPPFVSTQTGPTFDHTHGNATGKFLQAERISFSGGVDTATITSVPIDLTALIIPEMSFWYHMFGADINWLRVLVSDDGGATFSQVIQLTGEQQTSNSDAWKEAIVNLSSYANDTILVRFQAFHSNFGVAADLGIDDLDIHEQPTCPKPQNLAVLGQTNTTVSLQWTSGGASNWNVEYGSVGFTPGTGTMVNASTNPFVVTGLSPNTSYQFYVRDSCGAGDVSAWIGPVETTTDCNPVSAPYTENFDGSSWTIGTFSTPGNINSCWNRDESLNYQMTPMTTTTSFATGPTADHTSGSGKFMVGQRFFGSLALSTVAILESPLIDLSALSVPEMSVWYHMFGADIDSLQLEIYNGVNWTRAAAVTGQQQNSKTDAWKELIINLSAYANDTIKVRFNAYRNSTFAFSSAIAIDDLDIHEAPSCPKPQNFSIVGKTNSTVTLQWTTGGAANWNIEYGSPGFTLGSGTMINATTNPFTVTGLSANTGYEFYVRDSCGAGDVSVWTGPVGDTTECNPVAAPYLETFDGANFVIGSFAAPGPLDACWYRDETLNYQWSPEATTTVFASGPTADHTSGSGKFLHTQRTFGSVTPSMEAIVETPLIDLTPLTIPEMSFWYHMFGADIDSLTVEVFNGTTWSHEHTITGQQQNAKTDSWKEAIVNISAYANDTIKIRFRGYRNSTFAFNSMMAIDDLDIHEQPTCPKPSGLAVTATSANSITLSWTTGGAVNWQVEYGIPGFTPGSGTIVNASTNPFVVTGLNSSSTYDFYVRDSCSATDKSFWTGPVSGTTDCLPLVAPFSENFDGSSWQVGPNFNDTGSVSLCWDRTPLQDYFWKPGPPSFISSFTGPAADHTTGSGKFLYAESLFGGGTLPFEGFIETPSIDLSALTVPELSFWYHMFGNNVDSLIVEIDNGGGYTQVWEKAGQQQTSGTAPWKEAIVNLAAYANDTVRIRFKASKPTFGTLADVAIDDVSIHEAPSCPKPQNLALVGRTNNSITLQWTTGGASNWNVEYGAPGFTPGTGTIVNAATNPFTVMGLSANTGYEFYVRDSCGPGDVSVWTGPIGDTTDCNPVAAPYLETFDGANFSVGSFTVPGTLDACWSRDETLNYQWSPETTTTQFASGPIADHTSGSGKFIHTQRTFGSTTPSMEAIVISPLIDLAPLTTPEMSFWYHMFGADIDSLTVEIFDGSNWNHEFSISGPQQNAKTDAWKEAIVNISAYANDTIKVRFKGYRNSTFAFNSVIAIDDLDIHEQPSCPKPSALTVTSTSSSSISLSWTSGGASNWQIEYGLAGFTPGTGTIVSANTNPFTVTGLNSSTTYDFYVRDSCGVGDVSAWYGTATGATDCLPLLAPFSENFDGPTWISGPNFNDTGSVAQCWIRTPLTNYLWRVGPPPFTSTLSGPSADHTSGSGKYIFAESIFSGGTAPFDAFIETPQIDLNPLTTPELRFWYHMFGNAIGTVAVEVDNGGGYVQVWSMTGQQQTSGTDPWKEAIVNLSAYANDTIQIRIKATKASTSTLADAAIDDITVDEAPSCPQPLNVTATTSTTTTITLSWNTGGASNWLIGYRTSGSSGPLTIIPANTNPFTVTGLSPSTSYDFYVKDSCGVGDVSVWEGPLGASTLCGVAVAPWSENFDGSTWVSGTGTLNTGNQINGCWTRPGSNNPNFGTRTGTTVSTQTGPNSDVSGTGNYLYTEASGGFGTGEITTPYIFIPNSLQNPRLKFSYHMFGTNITSLALQVDNGSGFGTSVFTLTGSQHTSNSDPWKVDSISLNAYKGDTIRVKFLGTNSGFNGDIAIDEVGVISDQVTGPCPNPTGLSITTITSTGFTINWTGNGNSQVEVVLSGQPQGSGTMYSNVSSPLVINSLTSNTAYDIYVRDSCGAGLFSQWINTSATTLICPSISVSFSYTSNWLALNFNSGATTNADSLYWTFGDGNSASSLNPGHTYGAAGTYVVTMNAFSDCGSTATLRDTIEVCDVLTADFSFIQAGDTVSFDASGSGNATSYRWDMAGVKDTTGILVDFVFPTPGTKSVTLTVYNPCGDSVKITKNVPVCLSPVASWTYTIISSTSAGMKVQFDGSASQNAVTYEWDFGDGSPLVTGQVMPQHTYITPGLFYLVRLKVTNTCGQNSVKAFRLDQIGLEELITNSRIEVFPNPASDFINIEWDETGQRLIKVEILDASGKMVKLYNLNEAADGKLNLDIGTLSDGYYIIRFTSDQGISQQKLIIE